MKLNLYKILILFIILLSCTDDEECTIPNQTDGATIIINDFALSCPEIQSITLLGEYITYQVDDHPVIVYNEDLNFHGNYLLKFGPANGDINFWIEISGSQLNIPQEYLRFWFSDINGDSGQSDPISDEMTYLVTTYDSVEGIAEIIFWGTYNIESGEPHSICGKVKVSMQ